GFNGSEGAYNFQQTRGSSVYTSTNYQKKNFRFFSYAMFNKQTNYENGGINDSIEMFGNQIPLKMDNASNVYGEKQFSQNIIYTIPLNIKKTEIVNIEGKDTIQEIIIKKPLLILGQSLLYTPKYKIYRDNAVDEIVYGGAFDYDSIQSFDSIYHSDLIFKLYAKTGDELLPIIKLGVFSEFMYKSSEIYNFREYVTTNNIGINIENWYKFGFYSESGKFFNWKLSYETFTKGSRADDNALKADANLNLFSEKFPIVINVFGNYSYRTPSPWLYRYYGNRVSWDATLERENLVNTKASISIKKLDLVLSGENGRLTNPVYFDENAKAAQLNGDLKYMNVQVAHILKIWRFRLGTNLTYQKLSDTINFKYPEITYKGSFYYEGKTISKSMFNQIGFEAYYFSSYYAPYYNPATALFYLQKNDLIGGMPLVNFFVNAQLRRSRVFLKFTNLNYLITKELFYTIPDYPLADTYFRFGVSWRFYD
ncbi:MAG: hypothetical protein KAI79_03045, partial [Bacteroidales bacterium]|nr:hypothetical protein [Bacteroidales bacterium]